MVEAVEMEATEVDSADTAVDLLADTEVDLPAGTAEALPEVTEEEKEAELVSYL